MAEFTAAFVFVNRPDLFQIHPEQNAEIGGQHSDTTFAALSVSNKIIWPMLFRRSDV